ncbi:MAG: urea ABC transporter permease subunit UrtB [Rhodospirillaceae bacterium]
MHATFRSAPRSTARWLAVLVALLLALAPRAHADPFGDAMQALGGDSFSDKIEAAEALGRLGDGRAVPALQALFDGRLYVTADKKVVIADPAGDAMRMLDPVTGTALGAAPAAALEKVRVNNRLRGAIQASLARLTLFSPDRAVRLAAARDALRHPSPDQAAALEKALQTETDAQVRAALAYSLAGAQLQSGTKEQKIAAIARLSGTADPQVRMLLGQLRNAPDLDAEVKAAADAALAAIERKMQLIGIGENLFQGISLGSVLLLAAIGLAITFGVMGVINMAHGEMIMLGAYSAFVVQELFRAFMPPSLIGLYLIVAIPVGFVVAGAVGIVLERTVIRFLYGRPLETLLATWGISLILQQIVRSIFGAPNKEVANPAWMSGGFELIGGFTVTWNRLLIIVFCLIVLGVLALVLRRTAFGLHMRAVSQNRDMAAVMGIRTARVDAMTFGLGSGIAGMAGVALSQIGNVSPNLGTFYIVDSFMVVVFGGVGNLMGTFIGAMTLGIVNKFLEPYAGAVLGKIVVLVAIILFIQKRPRGLFALKGRAAEM